MSCTANYCAISDTSLKELSQYLDSILEECILCPRQCRVNRLKGEQGVCCAGVQAKIASSNLHFGEEPPISGNNGSGTIFFSGCTLHCVFCQNYPISHLQNGEVVNETLFADWMLNLQKKGAHNINLVTPDHHIAAFVKALIIARRKGLTVPIVYNCSGYERVEIIRRLKNIVDIYMPDAKYGLTSVAKKYSDASDYPLYNRSVLKEMFSQAGNLVLDENGIAQKGLIIRHLVLPGNILNSKKILTFIRDEISPDVYISLMSQYHPVYKSHIYDEINTTLKTKEYEEIVSIAEDLQLNKGWRQTL